MLNYVMLTKNAYTNQHLSFASSTVIQKETPSLVMIPCHDTVDANTVMSCNFSVSVHGRSKPFGTITEDDVKVLLGNR